MAPPRTATRPPRRTQAERSETTTSELLDAAREHFATRGFAGTSIEDIVQAAGVTRGALYHHFPGKVEVFRAVYEAEERRLADALRRQAKTAKTSWDALRDGCHAFLADALDPYIRQIVLLDAPVVLGWESVRAVESESTTALLRVGLERAARDGYLRPGDLPSRTALLTGALCDAAMLVARADDQPAALRRAAKELDFLLSGFVKPAPSKN